MIQKYIPILPLVAALFVTFSCGPKEEPPVKDNLTVSPASLEFEAEDTKKKPVVITTNGDWKATADSWIHLDKTSGSGKASITVTVEPNKKEESRTGTISISGAQNATVSVSQQAAAPAPHIHEGFTDPSDWSLVGPICGGSWDKDIAMKRNGDWHGAFDIEIAAGEEFKFRQNGLWDTNYGYGTAAVGARLDLKQNGDNIQVGAGTYDIYLAPENGIAYILNAGDEFTHFEEGKPVVGGTLGGPYSASLDPSKKLSGITYQINVYSFADSDGDGWGDFKGIENHLDYLDRMGATALWLSPAHPADSYHGYDVVDYYALNPHFGTEQAFKNLIDAAHARGIKIYMDYVLNHTGKGHPWFKQALMNPSSPYRDYYFLSANPSADYSKFPMLSGTRYISGEWKQATTGSPRLTITKTDEAVTSGSSDWNLFFWQGNSSKEIRFKDRGDGTMYLVLEINGECGMLLRRFMNWDSGSKFGASGNGTLAEGTPMDMVWNGDDIGFKGLGRYKVEISNLTVGSISFMGAFGDYMPDLNYGKPDDADTNPAFLDLAASADKWINLGVDGFRLDAVRHICGGIDSFNDGANQTLLQKWYAHCNATYKAAGHADDIYMVGEVFTDYAAAASYYRGLPSIFGFSYWWTLRDRINSGKGGDFASTISGFQQAYKSYRTDYIDAIKLSNHDEDRAASDFGNKDQKKRLAAAVLLTSPGKPYIYQGEELGYWGTKSGGDEYVRAPILWTQGGTVPSGWSSKIDRDMLKTEGISVAAQSRDDRSLLQLYYHFAYARNTNEALADGTIEVTDSGDESVAAWYMNSTSTSKRCLVLHNFSNGPVTVTRNNDNLSDIVVSNAGGQSAITVSGKSVTIPGYSSVVFNQ